MALKLAFPLPALAVLGAAQAIPDMLDAIPSALDYWDCQYVPPVVQGGAVTQLPTVFGPDNLDTVLAGATGSRVSVLQEGRPGVMITGPQGLQTTGFSSGSLTGGFCIALFFRLNAATNSLRIFTMNGVAAASGRMVYYDQSGNPKTFNFGVVGSRRLGQIVGWHGLILDYDGTNLRCWDVAQGFTPLGTAGTILPGQAAPAGGVYSAMTALALGGVNNADAGMTLSAALYCNGSLWGTAHMTTVETWLKYKLGLLA